VQQLMSRVERLSRWLRFGTPIIVVSGLPRSGTSMAMKMLEASGVPLLTDRHRPADESNPYGYFEFGPVKDLERAGDQSWLPRARGKAVKIVSFLLTWLPETYDYRVLFMHRDLDEVIASQKAMLVRRDEAAKSAADDDAMRRVYAEHLQQMERFMASRQCFRRLPINYRSVIEHPGAEALRICDFLSRPRVDVEQMAAAIDPALYRNRR
jgi:hypothetical protein